MPRKTLAPPRRAGEHKSLEGSVNKSAPEKVKTSTPRKDGNRSENWDVSSIPSTSALPHSTKSESGDDGGLDGDESLLGSLVGLAIIGNNINRIKAKHKEELKRSTNNREKTLEEMRRYDERIEAIKLLNERHKAVHNLASRVTEFKESVDLETLEQTVAEIKSRMIKLDSVLKLENVDFRSHKIENLDEMMGDKEVIGKLSSVESQPLEEMLDCVKQLSAKLDTINKHREKLENESCRLQRLMVHECSLKCCKITLIEKQKNGHHI